MKNLRLALLCLFAAFAPAKAQVADYSGLDSLLLVYYDVLARADEGEKFGECDFLIGSCKDSLTRQHVALELFNHYRDSRIMGEESVAVHIWDRWFKDNSVSFKGDFDRMDAELFVNFNRSSLIGCDAPEVTLMRPCGGKLTVPELNGRTSVFFFYDPDCSKCKLTAQLMPTILKDVDFKVNLYAVMYGSDKRGWRKFRREFKTGNRNVRVVHLWDPEVESDYQRLYGILTTPKILVSDPQGTIIGRRLEAENLVELIPLARSIQNAYLQASSSREKPVL